MTKKFCRMPRRGKLKAEFGVKAAKHRSAEVHWPLERIPSTAVTIRPLDISTPELEESSAICRCQWWDGS